jgi:hypothetical protein
MATTVMLVVSSCGGRQRSYVLADEGPPSTTTLTAARPSSSVARRTTTSRRSTTAVTQVGSAALPSPTTRLDRCPAGAAAQAADAAVPDGVVTTSAPFGLRIAHPADWPVTDVTVRASEVLDPRTLLLVGLDAETVLSPLAVRAASAYPGIAVFRFPRPPDGIDLATLTGMMREFQHARHFTVADQALAGCIDGEVAAGLAGTTTRVFELVWLTFHRDSFYVIACLAKDDGTPATHSEATAAFQRTLDTLRWLP